MKEFLDNINKIKENPDLKKKVIIATLIFFVFFIVILVILFNSNSKNTNTNQKQPENNISENHFGTTGDSTVVAKKTMDNYPNSADTNNPQNPDALNGISPYSSSGENSEAEMNTNNDADLNNYMKQREISRNRMFSSSRNTMSSDNNNRRRYNPNGNSSDWTSEGSSDYYPPSRPVSYSNQNYPPAEQTPPPTPAIASNRNSTPPESNPLNEKERRRLMLRTGKKDIENTQNIKINIDGTQYIRSGQSVKLKFMQDAVVSGQFIPKYSVAYGIASFSAERVNIHISSIKLRDNSVSCSMEGYSTDGNQGISVNIQQIEGISNVIRNEANNELGVITNSRIGNILSAIFSSTNPHRNEVRVKLLNNHQLIFKQQW